MTTYIKPPAVGDKVRLTYRVGSIVVLMETEDELGVENTAPVPFNQSKRDELKTLLSGWVDALPSLAPTLTTPTVKP